MSPDPAMLAARARLRAWLDAQPPATPAEWEREGLSLSVYGELPRLDAGGPVPPDDVWPAELRPGPQPWNAGITPGWPPAPAPPAEIAAAVGELAAATRAAERAAIDARKADKRGWEVAQWVADLERQIEELGRELESLRAELAARNRDAADGTSGESR